MFLFVLTKTFSEHPITRKKRHLTNKWSSINISTIELTTFASSCWVMVTSNMMREVECISMFRI